MVSLCIALALIPLVEAAAGLVPGGVANRLCHSIRPVVTGLALTQALLAAAALVGLMTGGIESQHVIVNLSQWQITLAFNGAVGLMLALVSFIGWIICQYSVRYLDGEATQGQYFTATAMTLGAAKCMILSGDLLAFALGWCVTSLGLHRLLLHYPERPAARRAAWTKFAVSLCGDLALVVAICLFYLQLGTLQFDSMIELSNQASLSSDLRFQSATVALAIAIVTKTAQLPFHTWLPLTMETPTPVSALMHAGIVNAGGYLLVRIGPLLSAAPLAQTLIVVVGTITACLAAAVMLTQTSLKKKLAYSTISQMGFMLMQCGLGAYSAAMLHILAHSLYKAYAFLSSGGIIAQRAASQSNWTTNKPVRLGLWCSIWLILIATSYGMFYVLGVDLNTKSSGWLLTALLCLGLTYWLGQALAMQRPQMMRLALPAAVGLLGLYALAFATIDRLVTPSTLHQPALTSWWLIGFVVAMFAALLNFQWLLMHRRLPAWLWSWQIHASNGFYIESWLRRQARNLST